MEIFEGSKVLGDVFVDGGVGVVVGFDGMDVGGRECEVVGEEFGIFVCEDIVCNGSEGEVFVESEVEGKYEGSFVRVDRFKMVS